MTQQMHGDGEEYRQQKEYMNFAEHSGEHSASFYQLSGQKIIQKRYSPIPVWRLALAFFSTLLVAGLTYMILTGITGYMDPPVIDGQLFGLGMAVASITIINIVFNLKRFGQRIDQKGAFLSFAPVWRLVLALISIFPVVALTYVILGSFSYAPELIVNKLVGLGIAIASITVINIVFNLQR